MTCERQHVSALRREEWFKWLYHHMGARQGGRKGAWKERGQGGWWKVIKKNDLLESKYVSAKGRVVGGRKEGGVVVVVVGGVKEKERDTDTDTDTGPGRHLR